MFGYTLIKTKELEELKKEVSKLSKELNHEHMTNTRLRKELIRRTDYIKNAKNLILGD